MNEIQELASIIKRYNTPGVYALVDEENKVLVSRYSFNLFNAVSKEVSKYVQGVPEYSSLPLSLSKINVVTLPCPFVSSHLDGKIACNKFIDDMTSKGYKNVGSKYGVNYKLTYEAIELRGYPGIYAAVCLNYGGYKWVIGVFENMRSAKEFGKGFVLETPDINNNHFMREYTKAYVSNDEIETMPYTLRDIIKRIKNYKH